MDKEIPKTKKTTLYSRQQVTNNSRGKTFDSGSTPDISVVNHGRDDGGGAG